MNPCVLALITGILSLTSTDSLGVEPGEREAKSVGANWLGDTEGAADEKFSPRHFVVAGASSGIEIATAVAIGVVGAALISYGEDGVDNGEPRALQARQDSTFESAGSNIRSTATTASVGTSKTVGIATTVSSTSTTTAAVGTSSASAVSSTGSM